MVPNRLDLRRVAGLAEASLMVALLTCGYSSAHAAVVSEEQTTQIEHTALQCWPAEEHIVLSANVRPPGDVQKTLLYFRWDRSAAWYFAPMMLNAQGVWVTVLPKTLPGTTGAVYYFESLSSSYISTRSPEYRVPVKPVSNCENAGAVIYTGNSPNITVGATRVGQPVPPGFDVSGIGSYISPTGVTSGASAGGGVSGKTLAIIGGAGGAAAAFLLAGDDSGNTTTSTDGIGVITTTIGTTTTTTGGGPSSTSTTSISGGGSTTSVGAGGGTTSTVGGGPTTTSLPGPSTTTLPGPSTTTLPGPSTTTLPGSSTTTTIPSTSTTTTSPSTTTTIPSTTTTPPSTTTTPPSTTTTPPSTTTAASGARLSVSKTGSANPVNVGNNLTYTVRVTNTGGSTANSVNVDDTVPNTMLILGTSANCTVIGHRVICAMQSITPGANKSITITVRPMSAGSFINRATVTAANASQASGQTNTQVN